jgi:hypothetical protein
MGQAIPRQQPAVVLRSQFNQLRALLAIALVAVAGLTVAVVILANDSDEVGSTSSVPPGGSINYGDSALVNPSTGYPTVPFPELEQSLQNRLDGTRYDDGPEEGTRGINLAPRASGSSAVESKHEAATAAAIGQSSSASSAVEEKDEAATAAAIGRQSSDGTVTRGSKASEFGTSQYRLAPPNNGTQLDEEAEEARRTDPHGPASALP